MRAFLPCTCFAGTGASAGAAAAAAAFTSWFAFALGPAPALGPRRGGNTAVRSPAVTAEVIDARVWEGIHFRFSDVAGARLGLRVAGYDLAHLYALGLY